MSSFTSRSNAERAELAKKKKENCKSSGAAVGSAAGLQPIDEGAAKALFEKAKARRTVSIDPKAHSSAERNLALWRVFININSRHNPHDPEVMRANDWINLMGACGVKVEPHELGVIHSQEAHRTPTRKLVFSAFIGALQLVANHSFKKVGDAPARLEKLLCGHVFPACQKGELMQVDNSEVRYAMGLDLDLNAAR